MRKQNAKKLRNTKFLFLVDSFDTENPGIEVKKGSKLYGTLFDDGYAKFNIKGATAYIQMMGKDGIKNFKPISL